jgi:hypothetical protein
MMSKRFIGIDPGSKGAMAILVEGKDPFIIDLTANIEDYLYYSIYESDEETGYQDTNVAVEDVCGRPGQSCQSNTTFMKLAGYAELLGYTLAQPIGEFIKVRPQVWKKHFGLITKGLTKTQRKHLSVDLAKRLYPSIADELLLSKDGRAEALLIARYIKDLYDAGNTGQ